MKAGKLRHRVTLQEDQAAGTQDSYGQEVEDWQDVATVWAAVEPLQGREFLGGKQLVAEVTTRIRIRYFSGLQIETATVAMDDSAITEAGNAEVVVTAAGMTGSPITTQVAVLEDDTADTVATKIIAALNAVGAITDIFSVYGSGPKVVLRRLVAAANDGTLNISMADGTCVGIAAAATSANTNAGVAKIVPEMQVVWGDHTYDVVSVIEPETRRKELVLMCREII